MRKLFIFFIFFSSNLFCKNKDSDTSTLTNDTALFTLVEAPLNYAACGVIENYVGFKFKKLNKKGSIVILIHCPELYGKDFFKVGEKYEIKILRDADEPKDVALINEFKTENIRTKFAQYIKIKR